MEQGLVFIKDRISNWIESNNLKGQFFEALCLLALEQPEQNNSGFLAMDLIEAIRKIRHPSWSRSSDPEQMSRKIRNIWNDAQTLWDEKLQGLVQGLSDSGINMVPKLDKIEGGGPGNPSRYKIIWETTDSSLKENLYPNAYKSFDITYICEDVTKPGFLARIFTSGIEITGWRKWTFVLTIGISLLLGWLLLLVFLGQVSLWQQVGTVAVFKTFGSLIIIWGLIWATIGKFINLPVNKVVSAPYWMQSGDGDRLLEHRHPPKYPVKSIKAVRYTAKCPICAGQVNTIQSKFEFMGRIVGRCMNAPVEHVFSFDHYTRSGKSLR